jgi:REP element-mobilizing transposase RayT
MSSARRYELTFFTATILQWQPLLDNEQNKDIIINSLRFLVAQNRIQLNAFVIMNNHLHLIWHILHPYKKEDVQRDFLGFTAKCIIKHLKDENPTMLNKHYVNAKDRKYQIWERNALSVDIYSEEVLMQKLNYIHTNPVNAGYTSCAEEYKYSTAALYNSMPNTWDFVTPCYL